MPVNAPRVERRRFLLQSAALAAGVVVPGPSAVPGFPKRLGDDHDPAGDAGGRRDAGLTDTSASPFAVLRAVGLGDHRWTAGFWADRLETCRRAMVPHLWRVMSRTDHSQFLRNFEIAAGMADGRHRGPAWNDGDFYKWLEAASALLAIEADDELDRRLDQVIGVIARAQRADGFLHTPVLIANRLGDADARPFGDRLDFEMYNLGHLMTAACVHHRATGKTSLLGVAIRAADFLVDTFRSPTPELARNGVCPSHLMGIVELYRTTREPSYLALARTLVDMRALIGDGTDDNQDRIPFREQSQAVGHAVRANYLYAGVADLHAETGDPTLLRPLRQIWGDVTSRKLAITGACGALYDGASPDGSEDQSSIGRVHQAYGRPYQLPQGTAHNESCASIGNVLWNWRMLQISGEPKYTDILELSLINAVLASVSLDGTRYFYTNTLRQLDEMPVDLRWSRAREPFISCFCCPPNAARTVAEAACYAYGRSDDAVWVHLYGAGTLDTETASGERLRLVQETDYPWDGRVRIIVEDVPEGLRSLRLRIPGWARGARLGVNGAPPGESPEVGTYAEISRIWEAGDVVELDLPMPVRLMQAHPLVEEARNQVAIARGPLVYCLESVDLPDGVKVMEVAIPREVEWAPRHDPGVLGGVTLIEGRAAALQEAGWTGQLYRELTPAAARPIDLRLIPYLAWGNRGPSEMTVWMPLGG